MMSQGSGVFDGIVELVLEMGGSMYPFILINRIVPSTRFFGVGTSYLFSIFSVIPQKFLLGFDYSKYTNLQEWLTFEVLNQNSGVGFSMVAEAYYNFGWLGLPLFFFLGLLISNIFDANNLRNKNLSYKLFSVFLFDALLFYPRGQIVTFMRPVILMVGVTLLIKKRNVINSNKRK
jgi:oligosaccharide repeat unit polymerase